MSDCNKILITNKENLRAGVSSQDPDKNVVFIINITYGDAVIITDGTTNVEWVGDAIDFTSGKAGISITGIPDPNLIKERIAKISYKVTVSRPSQTQNREAWKLDYTLNYIANDGFNCDDALMNETVDYQGELQKGTFNFYVVNEKGQTTNTKACKPDAETGQASSISDGTCDCNNDGRVAPKTPDEVTKIKEGNLVPLEDCHQGTLSLGKRMDYTYCYGPEGSLKCHAFPKCAQDGNAETEPCDCNADSKIGAKYEAALGGCEGRGDGYSCTTNQCQKIS